MVDYPHYYILALISEVNLFFTSYIFAPGKEHTFLGIMSCLQIANSIPFSSDSLISTICLQFFWTAVKFLTSVEAWPSSLPSPYKGFLNEYSFLILISLEVVWTFCWSQQCLQHCICINLVVISMSTGERRNILILSSFFLFSVWLVFLHLWFNYIHLP